MEINYCMFPIVPRGWCHGGCGKGGWQSCQALYQPQEKFCLDLGLAASMWNHRFSVRICVLIPCWMRCQSGSILTLKPIQLNLFLRMFFHEGGWAICRLLPTSLTPTWIKKHQKMYIWFIYLLKLFPTDQYSNCIIIRCHVGSCVRGGKGSTRRPTIFWVTLCTTQENNLSMTPWGISTGHIETYHWKATSRKREKWCAIPLGCALSVFVDLANPMGQWAANPHTQNSLNPTIVKPPSQSPSWRMWLLEFLGICRVTCWHHIDSIDNMIFKLVFTW